MLQRFIPLLCLPSRPVSSRPQCVSRLYPVLLRDMDGTIGGTPLQKAVLEAGDVKGLTIETAVLNTTDTSRLVLVF